MKQSIQKMCPVPATTVYTQNKEYKAVGDHELNGY